ncbi:MAG: serine hydrolase domain-containing protein [Chthoniobacteraceae bacterium]
MMQSRRSFVTKLGIAGAALATAPDAFRFGAGAANEPLPVLRESEEQAIAKHVREFMEKFRVPGMSIAIAREGSFVLSRGFGVADKATGAPVTPDHLFRIASVSKPFTSATIFTLIEQGRLALDDLVFGEKGRLGFDFGRALPDAVREITVHHLLTHTAGGWTNKRDDPMFMHPKMGHRELIGWTLANQPLTDKPGTKYAYSNFGYCILGRLIEKLTGVPYAQAVKRDVLAKCGITTMRIVGNTLADRAPNEVSYYADDGGNPYGMNVTRMDSHGGWIARASDLVRFAMRVDGFPNPPDILRAESIRTMTTPTAASGSYACGWQVNKAPNWWHNGSLPGTSALIVRTASGLCWAALANIRIEGIGLALDQMIWKIAKSVPEWRA